MTPIKNINVNKLVQETKGKLINFEVDPLDIGLTEIQHNLIQRLEREIPEYGDFAPVVEKFESKNPERELSTIKVKCEHDKKALSKKIRELNLSVTDRARQNEYICTIAKGNKKDILEYIKEKDFFQTCKKVILKVEEQIENTKK